MEKGLNVAARECVMERFIVSVILLTLASSAQAKVYFELGVEGGGDNLISTTTGAGIRAGGGLKIALGVQKKVGENGKSLSLSLGYLFDEFVASNGIAEISTRTLDAIYSINRGNHRFGIGASYHMGPTYKDDIAGFSPLKIEFDDALGLILQYSYVGSLGLQGGFRFTQMDYEVNGISLDAGSFGIFLSNGF